MLAREAPVDDLKGKVREFIAERDACDRRQLALPVGIIAMPTLSKP
jgi:hypothetical protein